MKQTKPEHLTATEAAIYLGMARTTFDAKVLRGELPEPVMKSAPDRTRANKPVWLWRAEDIEEHKLKPLHDLLRPLNASVRAARQSV